MADSEKNGSVEPPGFEDELFSSDIHEMLGEIEQPGAEPVAAPTVEPSKRPPSPSPPAAAPVEEKRYQRTRHVPRWILWAPIALAAAAAAGYAAWTFLVSPWIEQSPPGVDIGAIGLSVDTVPPGATVWLRLGQTPVTSPVVSTSEAHRIRIAQVSRPPRVLEVRPDQFHGEGARRRAQLTVALDKPKKPAPATAGEDGGSGAGGRIEIRTRPEHALIWLELGQTPAARLTGLGHWKNRELLLELDGYAPKVVKLDSVHFGDDGWGHLRVHLQPMATP